MDHQPERRRHVRIHDAVGLRIAKLEELPAAGDSPEPGSTPRDSVDVGWRKHDKYQLQGYAIVRRDYPAVADYIDNLEERIRQLLLDGEDAPEQASHKVSLSAGGISFSDRQLLHPGQQVSLTITLFPEGHRIGTDARIVAVNESPELVSADEPSYRAVFLRMSDADRQAISSHVTRLISIRSALED